ncbi:MAG: primosomal protein N', partial [Clostridiales bacterium]|nr:primosomal protein N' [Candidatus Apopatocola equi]
TWHSDRRRLVCHYCGHTERVGEQCPECGGKLSFTGVGTQKLEEQLRELFPDTEILRMDADSVSPAGSHEAILSRFRQENIPILIGTQMVTKGLDFPNVTLVGVISADQSLYAGSYRSAERCFSLITQVVGRAGRSEKSGRALIQSYTPGNQVIRQAAAQDYNSFYESEIRLRQLQYSPPFSDTLALTATGEEEITVLSCADYIRDVCRAELWGREDVQVLGPAPLSVVRVNRRYRYRVTVACHCDRAVRELVSSLLIHCNTAKEYKGVSVFADMDPME